MKGKIYVTTVFVFIFIFIPFFYVDRASVANYTDLNKMMDVIDENEGRVTEWQMFAREPLTVTKGELLETSEKWKRQYPEFVWKEQEENGRWILSGTSGRPGDTFKEKLQIAITLTDTAHHGYILYEIKGTEWSEQIQRMTEERMDHFLPDIFRKTPFIFTCIEGVFSDMMDIAVLEKAMQINELFHGEIVEKLDEEQFVSLTSNSPFFSNNLTANEKTFNVQISVRKINMGEDAVFAIGTPILTIEY